MESGKTKKSLTSGVHSQRFAMFLIILMLVPELSFAAAHGSASWDESKGRIKLKSVCANHFPGSIDARKCRAEAVTYFKRQCGVYKKKAREPNSAYRMGYKLDRDKYCYAARHFKIIAR